MPANGSRGGAGGDHFALDQDTCRAERFTLAAIASSSGSRSLLTLELLALAPRFADVSSSTERRSDLDRFAAPVTRIILEIRRERLFSTPYE